jgi:quercetin dioxygenase-like cupin family protein
MSRLPVLLLLLPAIGCSSEPAAPAISVPLTPQFTVGTGVTANPLGQATFDIDKVKRITGNWHVELKAKDGLDIAVRSFTYAPDAQTGWHRHPGPVFIQVVEGEVTFYEADDPDCKPNLVKAGESYVDVGDHAHIGRNESGAPARDLVVLFGPPGLAPTGFRIDAPDPGHCPFSN